MKKLFIIIAFILMFIGAADKSYSQVYVQSQQTPNGVYTRLLNNTSYTVSCYLRDNTGVYAFMIPPWSPGPWYRLVGSWQWGCQ